MTHPHCLQQRRSTGKDETGLARSLPSSPLTFPCSRRRDFPSLSSSPTSDGEQQRQSPSIKSDRQLLALFFSAVSNSLAAFSQAAGRQLFTCWPNPLSHLCVHYAVAASYPIARSASSTHTKFRLRQRDAEDTRNLRQNSSFAIRSSLHIRRRPVVVHLFLLLSRTRNIGKYFINYLNTLPKQTLCLNQLTLKFV
jgi:hypothetical protein